MIEKYYYRLTEKKQENAFMRAVIFMLTIKRFVKCCA